MSELPSQTISVKDISTKSVVLYPFRAHITRDVNDVILRPGTNTIEIYGLSPTIDEHSVQIDGKGAATIIDMTVDLVPNRDIFEEIYPDDDEDSDREAVTWVDSDDDDDEVKAISKDIKGLRAEHTRLTEQIGSINKQVNTLDKYSTTVHAEKNNPKQVQELLQTYRDERATLFNSHAAATVRLEQINKKLARREHEKVQAEMLARKKTKEAEKAKAKAIRLKYLRRAEKRRAAEHIRNERMRFWPKKVYRILLQLETATDTPGSSRRGSLDSVTLAGNTSAAKASDGVSSGKATGGTLVSLSLSYVTKEAKWGPRYDISINTVQRTATIVYRTEFINHTSETWKDAKVSFSTSQTSYQGLDDTVPTLNPWHIKLLGRGAHYGHTDEGLYSNEETGAPKHHRAAVQPFDRTAVFGKEGGAYVAPDYDASQARQKWGPSKAQTSSHALQDYQSQLMLLEQQNKKRLLMSRAEQSQSSAIPPPPPAPFGSSNALFGSQPDSSRRGGGLFGVASSNTADEGFGGSEQEVESSRPRQRMLQMARKAVAPAQAPGQAPDMQQQQLMMQHAQQQQQTGVDFDNFMQEPTVDFEESSFEDTGMTATYEIPGTRTLIPSSQTRRHKIVSLNAANIALSHIAVPKLRTSAFLRAKIRNPSTNVTLLKGSAGVTLDGSFLGNIDLPRVAAGQAFDLPLGVDPSIHVSYPKPTVRRSTQGILNKESQQVFSRAIYLTNTKSTPVELLVLDQVPVSQDERLRVDILDPVSLHKEGATVRTGTSAKEAVASESGAQVPQSYGTAKNVKWGSATATLKKEGEINWNVKMEKASACLLKLEYEARLPTNERIMVA